MSAEAQQPDTERRGSKPQSFRGRSMWVNLTVKDLRASLEWYRDVVGFTVEGETERDGRPGSATLIAGQVRIRLNQDDGAKGWDRAKGEGFSIHIRTAQDVDEIARQIRARGGKLAAEPAELPIGARGFRLVDPDGYKIAISQVRE